MTPTTGGSPEPSRIRRVTLRARTPHFLIVQGRLSGPFMLDEVLEVQVGDLGQRPGEFNAYESDDGTTILVRVGDELRG
jgi:hypothetical protein